MSKEPAINEEKIAIENAIRKEQRTIEDYIVNRVESLERTINQQNALINLLHKNIAEYEMFIELLKKHAEVGARGWVSINFYNDETVAEVIRMLGLEKGNENE